MTLPWIERVGVLSINPDAASRDDVARLAAENLELRKLAWETVGEVGMNDTLRPLEEFLRRSES